MKKIILSFLIAHFAFLIAQVSSGQIIHVPADQPTIQAGIDAAADGDTVFVADGLYFENIDFLGKKPLMVASHFLMDGDTNHINNTIIHGGQNGPVVTFITGEDTTSVICGFTITGGTGMTHPAFDGRVGGGIVCFYAGAKIIQNKITNNEVSSDIHALGGGIYGESAFSNKWIIISGNTIANNQCIAETGNAQGGGAEIVGDAWIHDNVISGNDCYSSTGQAWGGGIFHMSLDSPADKLIFHKNEVYHNTLESCLSYGAGLHINGSEATISENQITYNIITGDSCLGGGLSLDSPARTDVIDNLIAWNIMVTTDNYWFAAGARCSLPQDKVIFRNNEFSHNSGPVAPTGAGGGLSVEEGYDVPVIIDANKFVADTAYHGGGIFERSSWNIQCHNNLFTGNYTFRGGAIGIWHPAIAENGSYRPIIINNTFTSNHAANDAGAIRSQCDINSPEISNCIFWQNNAPLGKDIYNWATPQIDISYSDIEETAIRGPWTGNSNLYLDPLFAGSGEHPFSLAESSPCIDSGTPDTTGLSLPAGDIIGNFRLWDGDGDLDTIIDMGAYEYGSIPIPTGIPVIVQSSKFKVQSYPNPSRGIVNCQLSIANCQRVSLRIYDMQGREVAVVMNKKLSAGEHTVQFDVSGLPDGIYLVRLQAGTVVATGKMVVGK